MPLPPQVLASAASVAAVALHLMHEHAFDPAHADNRAHFQRAAVAVAHLLDHASVEKITSYVAPMRNKNGFTIDSEDVLSSALLAIDDDPWSGVIDGIDHAKPAWQIHVDGDGVLHVHAGGSGNPALVAAETCDLVPHGAGSLVVLAAVDSGRWAVAIRHEGWLTLVGVNAKNQVTWQPYKVMGRYPYSAMPLGGDAAARCRVRWVPAMRPFPTAVEALVGLGLSADMVVSGSVACSRGRGAPCP
jgi:hypothetical protein